MSTHVLAAPADPGGTPTLVVFAALAFAVYLLSCLVLPWKRCVVCQDRKKFPHKAVHFRMCPRCHGRGREFRVGTRIIRGIFGFGFDKFN